MNRNGVKITFHGNVLYCNKERTHTANWILVMYALALILDPLNLRESYKYKTFKPIENWTTIDFELMGGTIEYYSAR